MENNNVKLSLYRIKNLILQYKYNSKIVDKNNTYDIILLMNKYINNIKEINLIYTVSDIESIKYNSTSFPDTLFKNDLINYLCFYTIILGFIDANIDFINSNETNYNRVLFDILIELRNYICRDYENSTKIKLIDIKKFSIKDFDNFFDVNNLELLECINSYIIGYMNACKYNWNSIHEEYIKLINGLNIYKNKNKAKFDKVKIKKKEI